MVLFGKTKERDRVSSMNELIFLNQHIVVKACDLITFRSRFRIDFFLSEAISLIFYGVSIILSS